MKILLLDNYDSFTFNLLHLLEQVDGHTVDVIRNDAIRIGDVAKYDAIILSPGPGLPSEAGRMKELLQNYFTRKKFSVYVSVIRQLQSIVEHIYRTSKKYNMASVRSQG